MNFDPWQPKSDEEYDQLVAGWERVFGPQPPLDPEIEAEIARAQAEEAARQAAAQQRPKRRRKKMSP